MASIPHNIVSQTELKLNVVTLLLLSYQHRRQSGGPLYVEWIIVNDFAQVCCVENFDENSPNYRLYNLLQYNSMNQDLNEVLLRSISIANGVDNVSCIKTS